MKKAIVVSLVALAIAASAQARDLRIVGSSTVFPFASSVIEQFTNKTGMAATIEATGSGGGAKLFCAGIGEEHPDITNSSRRIKDKEVKLCAENGITNVTEYKIGYDGITVLNAIDGPELKLSKELVFKALNRELEPGVPNPHILWSDIDPTLPNMAIKVMGPPPSSGTRDAFEEIVLEELAEEHGVALEIREDGAYIEAGENDNAIIAKLTGDTGLVGIAGFSFLDQNYEKVKGASFDDVEPSFDNIAEGSYPVSRSLWFYVKNDHLGIIKGIEDYVFEFTSESTWGEDGYLIDLGLINLADDERIPPVVGQPNGKFAQ